MFEKPKTLYIFCFLYTTNVKKSGLYQKKNCSICKIKTYRKLKAVFVFFFSVQGQQSFILNQMFLLKENINMKYLTV